MANSPTRPQSHCQFNEKKESIPDKKKIKIEKEMEG